MRSASVPAVCAVRWLLSRTGRVTRVLTAVAPGVCERIMARALRSELER